MRDLAECLQICRSGGFVNSEAFADIAFGEALISMQLKRKAAVDSCDTLAAGVTLQHSDHGECKPHETHMKAHPHADNWMTEHGTKPHVAEKSILACLEPEHPAPVHAREATDSRSGDEPASAGPLDNASSRRMHTADRRTRDEGTADAGRKRHRNHVPKEFGCEYGVLLRNVPGARGEGDGEGLGVTGIGMEAGEEHIGIRFIRRGLRLARRVDDAQVCAETCETCLDEAPKQKPCKSLVRTFRHDFNHEVAKFHLTHT